MSAEDRVYADRAERAEGYVAADTGVVAVSLSGNRVGRFRIDRRSSARDVAADGGRLAVATDEDVLVATPPDPDREADAPGGADYRETGFGPAVAVGFDAGDVVAAAPDGEIGRRVAEEWFAIADVDAAVRAIDGGLVAAEDGVYRANPDGLDFVGLDDVHDVAAAGPYAATEGGLYELGNGWMDVAEGPFDAVGADADRAHAAGDRLLARRDDEWHDTGADPEGRVAGVAHAAGTYAVTEEGTVLASAGDGLDDELAWNARSLGVPDVGGIAIPRVE